ncbi:MAG: hypothetical protein K6L81_01785 [Agarilytica sp.]
MTHADFIYMSIYRGALKEGAVERMAKDAAQMGLDDWKKNKIGEKVSDLIKQRIAKAKRDSK